MKVAPRQANAFLASIPAAVRALLLHGNDLGLISERARKVATAFSDDLDDVFSVTHLEGDQLAGDAGALGDAAEAIAMTAPCRLVLVKGTTTRHALVKLFETAENAAALGCYGDDARDIGALLRETMARDGISVTEDAAALVVERLGSDRAVSRQEIEKLALLAGPGGTLGIEEVSHALGDSASLAVTDIAMATADGNVELLQKAVGKAWTEQQASVMVLRGCQGYFKQMLAAARAVQRGSQAMQAVKSLRPPLHFRLQDRVAAQLRFWPPDAILDAVNRLQDAELAVKTGAADDETQCAQTLLGICIRGRALKR